MRLKLLVQTQDFQHWPATKDKPALLEMIRTRTREIRHELGIRVRNQLRVIPDLQFFIDDSLDYIDNIDHLLKENP